MANPEDLGRYRLKRLLGRGALGEVWEANDIEEQGAKVAVKIMRAAESELALARDRFAREARLAQLLRHPHIVTVHDAGEAAGTSFMVMDMVEGTSLRAVLGDPSLLSLREKLGWIRQIGDGLAAMHRAGIVHRDLKPANVIIREDRSACIVDFGVAKWTKFDLGASRDPREGIEPLDDPPPKQDYMPPETAEDGFYDELGDQWAWAVLAHEILTGSVPMDVADSLVSRDDLPSRIAAAIDRARSLRREDRWATMDVALDELVWNASGAERAEPGEPEDLGDRDGASLERRRSTMVRVVTPLPFFTRFWLAWVCFFRVLFDGMFAAKVDRLGTGATALLEPSAEAPKLAATSAEDPREVARLDSVEASSPPNSEAALQLLALLQREGRLVDFLEEDVASFSDADIGAAARVVHSGCRKALREHVKLEPVRSEDEGAKVVLPAAARPAEVKLTGNVSGTGPYTGTLRHRGWRAVEIKLPTAIAGHDAFVVAQAEVEL